jgi:hypothetical protein
MSCYTRHLQEAMRLAGLPFDAQSKRQADSRIRRALGLQGADCPEVWQRLKTMSLLQRVALLDGARETMD